MIKLTGLNEDKTIKWEFKFKNAEDAAQFLGHENANHDTPIINIEETEEN